MVESMPNHAPKGQPQTVERNTKGCGKLPTARLVVSLVKPNAAKSSAGASVRPTEQSAALKSKSARR